MSSIFKSRRTSSPFEFVKTVAEIVKIENSEDSESREFDLILTGVDRNRNDAEFVICDALDVTLEISRIILDNMPIAIIEGLTETKAEPLKEEFKTFGVTVELREVKKFRVALTDLGTQAVKVIKLITELTDLSLETVMSKAEQLPFVIYESAYQFEAEEILCKLENIGATVEIDEL